MWGLHVVWGPSCGWIDFWKFDFFIVETWNQCHIVHDVTDMTFQFWCWNSSQSQSYGLNWSMVKKGSRNLNWIKCLKVKLGQKSMFFWSPPFSQGWILMTREFIIRKILRKKWRPKLCRFCIWASQTMLATETLHSYTVQCGYMAGSLGHGQFLPAIWRFEKEPVAG